MGGTEQHDARTVARTSDSGGWGGCGFSSMGDAEVVARARFGRGRKPGASEEKEKEKNSASYF